MTRFALVVAALLLGALPAPPAHAARVYAIVIGDSITCRAQDELATMRPAWVVDCEGGRKVGTLRYRIRANLREHGTPANIVLALGTNESAGWTRADYAAAVDMLPRTTHVLFVTTYRDPAFFPDRARIQVTYSWWMRQVDRARANVSVVKWRAAALAGTALLPDGVHPDDPSQLLWAAMVCDGVRAASA